jgi:hypothetical protein
MGQLWYNERMFSIFGVFCGFIVAAYCSGRETGEKGRVSLKIRFRDYFLHFHHWICASIALIATHEYFENHFWNHQDFQIFLYSFLIGLIIQGLTYKDFYKFVYRADDKKEDVYF